MRAEVSENKFTPVKEKLAKLSKYIDRSENSRSMNYKKKLLIAYAKTIHGAVNDLLNDKELNEEELKNAFSTLLAKNWELVKNTGLSYLSIPNHPVTMLLCQCAKLFAEATPGVLEKLMPDVGYEIYIPNNANKDGIYKFKTVEMSIENLLVTHVLSENQYLINVPRVLSLTPDLNDDTLEEHKIISELDRHKFFHHSVAVENLYNLYLDFIAEEQGSFSLANAIERLLPRLYSFSHSHFKKVNSNLLLTIQAIDHFLSFYEKLSEDIKASIPTEITNCVDYLEVRCVHLKSALESSEDKKEKKKNVRDLKVSLGEGAKALFAALQQHRRFLNSLSLEQEDQAVWVGELKCSFNELNKFSKQPSYSGSEPPCYPDDLFKNFNLKIEFKNISQAIRYIETASASEIKTVFSNKNYRLLRTLMRRPEFNSDKLIFLGHVLPIENYCALLDVLKQAEERLDEGVLDENFFPGDDTLNNIPAHFSNLEKFKKMSSALGLFDQFWSPEEFSDMFLMLDTEQQQVLIENLSRLSFNKIKLASQFKGLLTPLSDDNKIRLIDAAKNRLFDQKTGVIQTADHFYDVISSFKASKNATKVFKALKSYLSFDCMSAETFNHTMSVLDSEGKQSFFEEYHTIFIKHEELIKSVEDLCCVIEHVDSMEDVKGFLDFIGPQRLSGFSYHSTDFSSLLENLSQKTRGVVVEALAEQKNLLDEKTKTAIEEFKFKQLDPEDYQKITNKLSSTLQCQPYKVTTLFGFGGERLPSGKRVPKNIDAIIKKCDRKIDSYVEFQKVSHSIRRLADEASKNRPYLFCGLFSPRDDATHELYRQIMDDDVKFSAVLSSDN